MLTAQGREYCRGRHPVPRLIHTRERADGVGVIHWPHLWRKQGRAASGIWGVTKPIPAAGNPGHFPGATRSRFLCASCRLTGCASVE